MAAIQRALPNARGRGLSHTVGRPQGATVALAAGAALLIAVFATGWAAIGMAVAVAVAGLAVSALSRAKIGGQTGDTLGAAQQLAFAAALVALAA
jgi:adenosylcobinamide-GDP ribazoletransferase